MKTNTFNSFQFVACVVWKLIMGLFQEGQKVTLNVYDLSQGLARQLSTAFLGRPIEAIW